MYEGCVQVYRSGKIMVLKNHVEPACEYPIPPEDEDDFEEEGWDDISLPRAA
jgi:hypothetical protein